MGGLITLLAKRVGVVCVCIPFFFLLVEWAPFYACCLLLLFDALSNYFPGELPVQLFVIFHPRSIVPPLSLSLSS